MAYQKEVLQKSAGPGAAAGANSTAAAAMAQAQTQTKNSTTSTAAAIGAAGAQAAHLLQNQKVVPGKDTANAKTPTPPPAAKPNTTNITAATKKLSPPAGAPPNKIGGTNNAVKTKNKGNVTTSHGLDHEELTMQF